MANYTEIQELSNNLEDAKDEICNAVSSVAEALTVNRVSADDPGDSLDLNLAEVVDKRLAEQNAQLREIAFGLAQVAAEIKATRETFRTQ